MVQFLGCRLLERGHLATLWIDTIEHALDGAVLAGGIHALEDEEQRPAVLRVQLLLKIGQPLAVGIQDRLTLFLVEAALGVGLVGVEMKFIGAVDTERRDVGIELGAQRPRMLLAHGDPSSVTCPLPPSFAPRYAVMNSGMADVSSALVRPSRIAESSGCRCRARLASIR